MNVVTILQCSLRLCSQKGVDYFCSVYFRRAVTEFHGGVEDSTTTQCGWVWVWMCVCVCVCVCVRERERESVCVSVCVCVLRLFMTEVQLCLAFGACMCFLDDYQQSKSLCSFHNYNPKV